MKTKILNPNQLEIPFLGEFTVSNMLDWAVTALMCLIIVVFGLSLGGSHLENHVYYLPLFALLLILHATFLVTSDASKIEFNKTPILLLPFMAWALLSVVIISPVKMIGWHEFIIALEAYIFFWVACNNLRKRVQFVMLLVSCIIPVVSALLIGFYQFFQQPDFAISLLQRGGVALQPSVIGRATGIFADPESLAMLILMVLPWAFIVMAVPRLPPILRILAFYLLCALLIGLILSQTLWALLVALVGCVTAVLFCFEKLKSRIYISLLTVSAATMVMVLLMNQFTIIKRNLMAATSGMGEGARLAIWEQAIGIFLANPILGAGAGSFTQEYEQASTRGLSSIPESPSSDCLLLLSEYGLLGFCLFVIPLFFIVSGAFSVWSKEPSRVRLKFVKNKVMPSQRFFLSIALGGAFSCFECFVLGRLWATPLLILFAAVFFAILVKSKNSKQIIIKKSSFLRIMIPVGAAVGGIFMVLFFNPKMQSAGLSQNAWREIELNLNDGNNYKFDNQSLENISEELELAVSLYPKNWHALLGLGVVQLREYYQDPSAHIAIGNAAADYFRRAILLNPSSWRSWACLGMAEGMQGKAEEAEVAFEEALALAPHNSNANYYYAAFMSQLPGKWQLAKEAVEKSLIINPANEAARYLKQKLLIE